MRNNTTKDIREIRLASLERANQVKYSQYPTYIHALPEKVQKRLNTYLNIGYPSTVCLRKLCSEFPYIQLPSYKSLQNYRKKYHHLGSEYQQTLQAQEEQMLRSHNRIKSYQ